jgi:hypothetical protein
MKVIFWVEKLSVIYDYSFLYINFLASLFYVLYLNCKKKKHTVSKLHIYDYHFYSSTSKNTNLNLKFKKKIILRKLSQKMLKICLPHERK